MNELTEAERVVAEATADRVTWGDGTEYINVEDVARIKADAHAAGVAEGRGEVAAVREAMAHVVRDHDMPPNKDRRGYDYRMGWWDAVLYADRIIRGGIRFCEDCPGDLRAALAGTSPQGEGER